MSKKILVVEDDSFLSGLEAKKLTMEGFEVSTAPDGETAVKLADQLKPDLILLDLILPGMDGFGVLEKVRKNEALKNVPILAFSNLSEEKDVAKAKELGAVDFMIKSNFTLDEVVAKVKEYI